MVSTVETATIGEKVLCDSECVEAEEGGPEPKQVSQLVVTAASVEAFVSVSVVVLVVANLSCELLIKSGGVMVPDSTFVAMRLVVFSGPGN